MAERDALEDEMARIERLMANAQGDPAQLDDLQAKLDALDDRLQANIREDMGDVQHDGSYLSDESMDIARLQAGNDQLRSELGPRLAHDDGSQTEPDIFELQQQLEAALHERDIWRHRCEEREELDSQLNSALLAEGESEMAVLEKTTMRLAEAKEREAELIKEHERQLKELERRLTEDKEQAVQQLMETIEKLEAENVQLQNSEFELANELSLLKANAGRDLTSSRDSLAPTPTYSGSSASQAELQRLQAANKALQEENRWLEGCLAEVREDRQDTNPDYDGQRPILDRDNAGLGRWTAQRAADRKDAQEMKTVQQYLLDQGLPAEASGWQQILFLWRRNNSLEAQVEQGKRAQRAQQTEMDAMQQLLDTCKAEHSSRPLKMAQMECKQLTQRVTLLESQLERERDARLEEVAEREAQSKRMKDMVDQLRADRDVGPDDLNSSHTASLMEELQMLREGNVEKQHTIDDLRSELADLELRSNSREQELLNEIEIIQEKTLLDLEELHAQHDQEIEHIRRDAQEQVETASEQTSELATENRILQEELEEAHENLARLTQAVEDKHQELIDFQQQLDQGLGQLQESINRHNEAAQPAPPSSQPIMIKSSAAEELERALGTRSMNPRAAAELELANSRLEDMKNKFSLAREQHERYVNDLLKKHRGDHAVLEERYQDLLRAKNQAQLRHEQAIHEQLSEKEEILRQADAVQRALNNMRNDRDRIQRQLETVRAELEAQLAEEQQERQNESRKLAQLTAEKRSLERSLRATEETVESLRDSHLIEKDQLQKSIRVEMQRLNDKSREVDDVLSRSMLESDAQIQQTQDEVRRLREEKSYNEARLQEDLRRVLEDKEKTMRSLKAAEAKTRELQKHIDSTQVDQQSVMDHFRQFCRVPGTAPRSAITEPDEQLDFMVAQYQRKHDELDSVRESLRQSQRHVAEHARKLSELQEELNSAHASEAKTKAALQAMSSDREAAQQRADIIDARLRALQEDGESTKLRSADAEQRLAQQQAAIADEQRKNTALLASLRDEGTRQKAELHKQLDQLQSDLHEAAQRENELKFALKEKSRELDRALLDVSTNAVERNNAIKERDLERMRREHAEQELTDIREELARAQSAQLEADVRASSAESDVRQKDMFVAGLQDQIAAAEEERDHIKKQLAAAMEENEALVGKMDEAQNMYSTVRQLEDEKHAQSQFGENVKSQLVELTNTLNQERHAHEMALAKLGDELLAAKAQLNREKRLNTNKLSDLERQCEVHRARSEREAQALAAADATCRQLREENQRLVLAAERARDVADTGLRSKVHLDALIKDRDRELANLRQENGQLTQDLARVKAQKKALEERARIEQSKLLADVRREMDAHSSTVRDLDRLRDESATSREREYTRKLNTIGNEVRRLGSEFRQDRFDKEASLLRSSTFRRPGSASVERSSPAVDASHHFGATFS
eukprot:m.46811 g.46811  ORF g.46811 m.46811 type:complete len:1447 (+) comp6324_c0_seq2:68-4408(+)